MPFEIFDKRMTPLAKAPSVTIQKRGVISLDKVAHDMMDNTETVELPYDRDRSIMALPAATNSSSHAYALRNGSKRGPELAMVLATAFTQYYGIDHSHTRRWKPFVEDGMLCVDLLQVGTMITGNCTKATDTPAMDATKAAEAPERHNNKNTRHRVISEPASLTVGQRPKAGFHVAWLHILTAAPRPGHDLVTQHVPTHEEHAKETRALEDHFAWAAINPSPTGHQEQNALNYWGNRQDISTRRKVSSPPAHPGVEANFTTVGNSALGR